MSGHCEDCQHTICICRVESEVEVKPREFKFKVFPEPEGIRVMWDGDFGLPTPGDFHVIEIKTYQELHSAYEQACKERDELKAYVLRHEATSCNKFLIEERDQLKKERDNDYADMRKFQAKFIEADHERIKLRAELEAFKEQFKNVYNAKLKAEFDLEEARSELEKTKKRVIEVNGFLHDTNSKLKAINDPFPDWPFCKIEGCKNKSCLAKNSEFCSPHTDLAVAVEAITDFNEQYKKDFHKNVCEQSMGCHCSETSLDRALAKIAGKLDKGEK